MGMSENESYLDSLLKAVMEPKTVTEPEVIEEPESVVETEVIDTTDVVAEPEFDIMPEMVPEPELAMDSEIEYIPEEVSEEPEIEYVPEEVSEEPEIEYVPEEVSEEPEIEYVPEEVSEELEIEYVPEEVSEEPEIEYVPEEVSEEPGIEYVPEEMIEEPEGDFMDMPEFVMDDDTAKEVQALLDMDYTSNDSVVELEEVSEEEAEIEYVPEEVSEEEAEIEYVPEEMIEGPEGDFMDMPEFVMDDDTAKEVQALLDMDYTTDSTVELSEVLEEAKDEQILEEISEESETEYVPEEVVDSSDFIDLLEESVDIPVNDENDDLLDEDIENLLGMESIETDDSDLEDFDISNDFNNEVEMIVPTVDGNQFSASPSLEETQTMSQEDIESLLNASSEVSLDDLFGGKSSEEVSSEDDLLALLSGGVEDVASADDLLALLGGDDDSEELSYIDLEDDGAKEETKEEEKEVKGKKEKKSKKKRKKGKDEPEGESQSEETEIKEKAKKKPGAFKKFMDFLMEEDEDEESSGAHGEMEMSEDQMSDLLRNVSDENKQIINELDKEEKKKKKRKKKGKKEEAEPVDGDEDEIDAKPTGKKKKQKKPKKEKKVKLEEYDPTAKKLSKKKVGITLGLIATIMVAILLVNYLYAGAQVLKKARNAYYAQDYAGCYETLYGKELSESDEILFNRSALMLRMSRSIEAYEGFMAADMPIQALDSLIQGIGRFEMLRVEAVLYELEQEAEKIYAQLVECLGSFGLTEQKALDIYNSESDEEYTNQLIDAVENGIPLVEEEEEAEKEYLYDALPVEEEIN